MDLGSLGVAAAALVAKKALERGTEQAADQVPDVVVRLWNKSSSLLDGDAEASDAIDQVVSDPQSAGAQTKLAEVLQRIVDDGPSNDAELTLLIDAAKSERAGSGERIRYGSIPLIVKDFQSRDDVLASLSQVDPGSPTALVGIPGIGKTQIAAKYFNDERHRYYHSLWVDVRNNNGLTDIENIARTLSLKPSSGSLIERVRDHIGNSADTWLVVFDNADNPAEDQHLLPQAKNVRIIVTSKSSAWKKFCQTIDVKVFETDVAASFLSQRANRSDDPTAGVLAEHLGNIPLSLSLAGDYCREAGISFKAFLDRSPAIGKSTTQAVCDQSLDAARKKNPACVEVMNVLAVLDWKNISHGWFERHCPFELKNLDQALIGLREYGLVELEQDTIAIPHNFLADGVSRRAASDTNLVTTLNSLFKSETFDEGQPVESVRHLRHLTVNHPRLVSPDLLPSVRKTLAFLLEEGAGPTGLAEESFRLHKVALGVEHEVTLDAEMQLAESYTQAGRVEDAVEGWKRIYARCQLGHGDDHPSTTRALDKLSSLTPAMVVEPSSGEIRASNEMADNPKIWWALLPVFGLVLGAFFFLWPSAGSEIAEPNGPDISQKVVDPTTQKQASVIVTGPVVNNVEAGAIKEALAAFDGDFTITYQGDEKWAERVGAEGVDGDIADIGLFPQPQKLYELVRTGEVVELDEETQEVAQQNWPEGWNQIARLDQKGDKQYGVFTKADVKSLVWYQPSIFEEKGYNIPKTFEELVALMGEMRTNEDTPFCVGIDGEIDGEQVLLGSAGTGQGWVFTDWVEDMVLRQHGLDFYDRWVNHQIPFDNPKVVESMATVTELWQTEGNVYTAANETIVTTSYQIAGEPLLTGDCLMHRQASFFPTFLPAETSYAAAKGAFEPGDLSVFYFPPFGASPDNTSPVLVSGDIGAGFNSRPETMEALRFLAGPIYAEARKSGGPKLGYLSLAEDPGKTTYDPLEQQIIDLLKGRDVRFDGSDLMPTEIGGENGEFLNQGTSLVAGDGVTATEVAQNIEKKWPE